MKAVFLDRDGTLNVERPRYLLDVKDLEIIEEAYLAIRLLNRHRYKSIVVTNQACVGKGLLKEIDLQHINDTLKSRLAQKNARIDSMYYCPHKVEDECRCRKPRAGMIRKAAEEHKLDLTKSYIIGDRVFDMGAGKTADLKTVLVLTGGGKEALKKMEATDDRPDHIANNVLEAVQWIIATDQ